MERTAERPHERRAASRTAVVWEAVRDQLGDRRDLVVLDIGGGTGGFAVRVATEGRDRGHRVTVVDPSPDALAALDRRAREHDVADIVTGHQGDLAGLAEIVQAGSVDLVLCHGVLGLVEDPSVALQAIATALAPGGALSLLVSQRHAAVLHRAMAGQFTEARDLLTGDPEGAERRFTAPELAELLGDAGFTEVRMQAVRVFADLVPASLLDVEPGAVEGLVDLERAVADRPEYLNLGAQLHSLASRG